MHGVWTKIQVLERPGAICLDGYFPDLPESASSLIKQ